MTVERGSLFILWDAFKAVLRGEMIAIGSAIKRSKDQKLKGLEEKLKNLEGIHQENKGPQYLEHIKIVRKEIDEIYKGELGKKAHISKTI